jgi:hypothetical protein
VQEEVGPVGLRQRLLLWLVKLLEVEEPPSL